MENITITNTDLTNTIYSDLLNWQYSSQVTTDGKIDYFKFKNENDLVFSDVWVIKMTDEGLSMNDQLVYLYRKSINSTLMFTSDLSCEQSLSYLREDPYRMSITYYFKRKDKSWDSSNIFSRTFYGYSGAVVPLEQENNEKPKFHIENTDYELQCLIKGVAYGGGWYGRITDNYILDVLNSSSSKTVCPVYKLPGSTLSNNELPDISNNDYDLVIPFTIDASFLGLTDQGNGWFNLRESSLRDTSFFLYNWLNTDDNSLDNQGFVKVYTYVIDYSTSEKNSWFSDPDILYFDSEEDAFNESGFTVNKKPLTKLLPTYPCLNPFTELLIKPDETYLTYLPFDRVQYSTSISRWTFVVPMKRSTSSGSNNSGLENFIGVVDSSDTYYNFDLNQNQNKIVFRNYNRNISCSPASLYGQVSYGALYPGSYRDENSIISKSNSIAVVAGYIRTQRLLINLKEYFNPSLQNRRTIYTVYNPYPIPIKIFYSRYINQYDFDVNHGLHYFSEDVWPWICQKGYFNCSLTGHQMPITRNYVISNASVTINPYSSSDITVDIYCEYSTNEELTYNYISLAYSLGNFENPFPYNSSSLFMDKVNFSDGGDNNTGSFNILYSLPANTITGNTSFEYKSCFWKNVPGYGTFKTTDTISLWTNSSHWYVDVEDLPAVSYNSSWLAQYIDLSKKEISVNAILNGTPSYIKNVIDSSDTAFPGYVVWYVKADQEDRVIASGITSLKWNSGYTFYVNAKIPDWYPTSTQYTYVFYYLYGMLGQGSTSTWHTFALTKR